MIPEGNQSRLLWYGLKVLLLGIVDGDVLPLSRAGMSVRIPFGYETPSYRATIHYLHRNCLCHW